MDTIIAILIVAAAAAAVGRWTWKTVRRFGRKAAGGCSCSSSPDGKGAACGGCPVAPGAGKAGPKAIRLG